MEPERKKSCKCGSGKAFENCCEKEESAHLESPSAEIGYLIGLFNSGRYADVEVRARLLVEQYQNFSFGWKLLGGSLQMQGKDALNAFQMTADLMPDDAEAHYNLGVVQKKAGLLDGAMASYRRALQIKPDYADAHSNLGNVLKDLGYFDSALVSYRHALTIKPNSPQAHNNLGAALKDINQLDEALACYQRAVEIKPDYAEAHYNLGNVLKDIGQLDGAVESYRRALLYKPDFADGHINLGAVLQDQNQLAEAEACYRRALEIKPDIAKVHYNLGAILQDQNRLAEAETSYRQALELKPDYFEAYFNVGLVLQNLGQLDGAVASYRRALEFKPDFAEAHFNVGFALQNLGQLDGAVASYRQALEFKPDYVEAHFNAGVALQNLGQIDGALDSYRRALKIKPDHADAYSNLLFCLSNSEAVDAATLFDEHCLFGQQFETPLRANWPRHTNSQDPERNLQIGFVSGDLRRHVVAIFIELVLAHLAKHPQLSLHAYYNHTIEDAVTQRLRGYLTHWHPIASLSDAALAEKIRSDGIDILIDLSGHTTKNRLLTFARKPAPVQASWMGYPGTTGLHAMDYYFADRFFLPRGQFDSQFTERIVRLPANAPFLPEKEAPSINELPALSNGYMTFGSFNRPLKINRLVIAQWSRLLRALPDSRILLAGMHEEGKYDTLIEWFAQEGIERNRLNFYARSDMKRYLGLHHRVDICLDTFPYNGGTTTLHALWMGVPTLTLAGHTIASRSGASILGHVGLEAFVAHDSEDFVQKGLSWAGDVAELSDIRTGLRERFAQSAIGQPVLVAEGLQRALRIMWQRWCNDLPPVDIDA